jgi:hypothetical protein
LHTILNTFKVRCFDSDSVQFNHRSKIQNRVTLATDLVELELDAHQRHQELEVLLAAQDDSNRSEYSISVSSISCGARNSTSFVGSEEATGQVLAP